jgi:hypothetical protein
MGGIMRARGAYRLRLRAATVGAPRVDYHCVRRRIASASW